MKKLGIFIFLLVTTGMIGVTQGRADSSPSTPAISSSDTGTTTVQDLTTLIVKNVQITVGSSFNPSQVFVSATDASGAALSFNEVTISGTVDSTKVGSYQLTLTNGIVSKVATVTVVAAPVVSVPVYRMYNPSSGKHYYTQSSTDRTNLLKKGWNCEGTGWTAPSTSNLPVYQIYNHQGDHFSTTNEARAAALVKLGWAWNNGGKPVFYSGGSVKVYVAYNPRSGSHNYTSSLSEQTSLIKSGWQNEGVAYYATNTGSTTGKATGAQSSWKSVNGVLKYYNVSTGSYTKQFSLVYYSQLNPSWSRLTYGGYSFGATGCGQTSIAMILSGFGIKVTPPMAASYAHGYGSFDRYPEVGSAQSDLTLVASHYNVSWTVMSSASQLANYLSKGYPATVCLDLGGGVRHIVVLTGYSNGFTTVTDPYNGLLFSGRHSVSQIWSLLSWKSDNTNKGASAATVYLAR